MNVDTTAALMGGALSEIPKVEAKSTSEQLKEKSDQFEAIIVKMMLDNALQDEAQDLFGNKDPGDKIYKSMYRDELSKVSAGGFGFSQLLFEYLSEQQS